MLVYEYHPRLLCIPIRRQVLYNIYEDMTYNNTYQKLINEYLAIPQNKGQICPDYSLS
jgi:hypothetical protein